MIRAPLSAKYIKTLTETLLKSVKYGESAFIRWFPGQGKTILLSQIFSDNILLSTVLGRYYKRFVIVKIDGLLFSESDFSGFLDYILQILTEETKKLDLKLDSNNILHSQPQSPILLTKKIISASRAIVNQGFEIIFVIDGIDDFNEKILKQLFFSLDYIVESNRERIHTHINVNKRDIIDDIVTQSALMQNIISISLPDRNECENFIYYYQSKLNFNLSTKNLEEIFKICGNDPGLIKESLRIFSKKKGQEFNFLSEPALLLKAKINYFLLGKVEKEIIEEKLTTDNISPYHKRIAGELIEAHFWDKQYRIPLIYEQVIIEKSKIRELFIDRKKKTLYFGDIDLSKKLTASEYKILLRLFQKFGKPVSRDEIAESIWGNEMLNLYSDWAIDKAISRLREKLSHLSFYYQIITKKKEGFLLEI